MKNLITFTIVLLLAITTNSQSCSENFNAEKLLEYPTEIDRLRPQLKVIRKWARNNNNAQAELVTNRLEYWAKDIARYVRKYAESHTDKVCERLTKTDYIYLSDLITLTFPLLDMQYPTIQDRLDAIDLTKYK